MVTANVDIAALKARHLLGDTVEAAGSARASAPSTTRPRAASRCTATRSGSTASAAVREVTCWTSSSGPRA